MKRFTLFGIFIINLITASGTDVDQYSFSRIDVNQGLSNNQVQCFYKDSEGFIWIGTSSGLNRYDGYTFKIFKNDPSDSSSIADNRINFIFEDNYGKLWTGTGGTFRIYNPVTEQFSTESELFHKNISVPVDSLNRILRDNLGDIWFISPRDGLFQYNAEKDQYTLYKHDVNDASTIHSNNISSIVRDINRNIWLIGNYGILEKIDYHSQQVIFRTDHIRKIYDQWMDLKMYMDRDGAIWISSKSSAMGAFMFKPSTQEFLHFHQIDSRYKLNNNIVTDIAEDDRGNIWIGTDHGGINLINKRDFSLTVIQHNPDEERSISQNSIISLYRDNEGIMWVGTYKKGACYYHENLYKFNLIQHQPNNPNSLPYDDVNVFREDEKGNLWIGTNGEGLCYFDRTKNIFTQYKNDPDNPRSLSNDIIVSLLYDRNNRLWIGTYYGGLNLFDGKNFTHFKHDPQNSSSIADDRVWEIFQDSKGRIWVGTLGSGLELMEEEGKVFRHFPAYMPNSIHSDYISHITEDSKGKLWIGTANGIDIFDYENGRVNHLMHNVEDTNSLSSNLIAYILIDSHDLVWVGTYSGLTVIDRKENKFYRFYKEDGLPDNSILSLVEDKTGYIWAGTTNGISRISFVMDSLNGVPGIECMNFTEADGLQGRNFNDGVVFKTSRGEIIFGGADGFNIFYPERLPYNKSQPKILITGLQIFNENIMVGQKVHGRVLLEKSLTTTGEIILKHFEDVISIEFTALNYIHPEKNKYEYTLEGFNRNWLSTGSNDRKATYTNLDPGEYIFRVRASNNDGVWNEKGVSLNIIVRPPFWKTKAAILIYMLLLFGALIFFRRLVLLRERLRFQHEQERQESLRRHELDLLKIRFFTNVSHEFRTPLSLIITPLEKMMKKTDDQERLSQLKLIYRNARRLLNLVNQLLDFRRMEVQKIILKPAYGNLVEFIHEIHKTFTDLSEKKNIEFRFSSSHKDYFTYFDHDKMEKIVFNLLSNAFKFTPERGKVTITLKIYPPEQEISLPKENMNGKIVLVVEDTGIGIPKENLDKIFDRFFQNEMPGTMLSQGSGIGLSLTSEFVKLHNGTIEVKSEPGMGSSFKVILPIIQEIPGLENQDEFEEAESESQESVLLNETPVEAESEKSLLLLVEDNDDFRFYLKDNLKDRYNILEASNGKEGLQKALSSLPDLIVSDIMMPEMDGIELCRSLKTNTETSHIPIILLTARMSQDIKQEGYDTGADDYLTKPFSFEILESRIHNLISQREKIKTSFQKHFKIEPGEIGITSLDEKLMKKALETVEKNMSDPEFSVEKLSRELGMSRVHLYKKLTALTGKSPIEFIRIMRLKRAAQYLSKSQLTVSEIAFEVGFNDPRYFSRYFKAEFGLLPSQYIQMQKKKKDSESPTSS